jgi:hypothetical protein
MGLLTDWYTKDDSMLLGRSLARARGFGHCCAIAERGAPK